MALAAVLGLDGAPAYYAMWARHLQLSYYDHPALLALSIRASAEVFGWNTFAVKLPAILLYALSSLVMWKCVRAWKGEERGAFYAVAFFNFMPWIASSFGIKAVNPDVPFVFLWLLAFYCFSRLYESGNGRWWLALGVIAAIGFNAKYKMILLYPALLACMFVLPKMRAQWRSPWLYIGAIIGLLGVAPPLIWNMENGFASFSYHLVERQESLGFRPIALLNFIGNQILIMGIFAPIMLARNAWKERSSEVGRATISFAAPFIIIFSAVTLFFSGAMQNWWAAVWCVFLILYGARAKIAKWSRRALVFTATASVIGTAFYAYPFGVRLRDSSGFLDFHSWDKAAEYLQARWSYEPVGTPRYRATGMLSFYLPNREIYSLDWRKRDQFQLWNPPSELVGKDVILVFGGKDAKSGPGMFDAARIELLETKTFDYNPWFSRTFHYYKLHGYRGVKQ
jgi:hypothetical protein